MQEIKRSNRDYILTIGIRGGEVTVKPPLRVSFQVDKSIKGSLNEMRLSIYNLSEQNRLAIVKDAEDNSTVIPISLSIGYEGRLETIYKGTIQKASNQRQGADILSMIVGLDGGIDGLKSFTNRTVEGNERAVDACLSDMPRTAIGKISERPPLTRPKVLVGNSLRLIEETIGPNETYYIDNEQLFIVGDSEVVANFVPVVSAATGLINTPSRESSVVTFQTMMNPSIKIGGRVNLVSTTAPHLNGVYKVSTISYAGDNEGPDWSQVCTGTLANEVTVL